MIYRLRNILNWVAFVALVLFILFFVFGIYFQGASEGISFLGDTLSFSHSELYWLAYIFYLYPLWVLIQYIIWKHPVFIPWHFKDDEEWN